MNNNKESFLDKFKGRTENIGKDGFQGLFSSNVHANNSLVTNTNNTNKGNEIIKRNISKEIKTISTQSHLTQNVNNEKLSNVKEYSANLRKRTNLNNVRVKSLSSISNKNPTKDFKANSITNNINSSNPISNNIIPTHLQQEHRIHSSPMGSLFPNTNFPIINGLSNIAMTNYNYNALPQFGYFQYPNVPQSMMNVYPHNVYDYNNIQRTNNGFVNMYGSAYPNPYSSNNSPTPVVFPQIVNQNHNQNMAKLSKDQLINQTQIIEEEKNKTIPDTNNHNLNKRDSDKQRIRQKSANKFNPVINNNFQNNLITSQHKDSLEDNNSMLNNTNFNQNVSDSRSKSVNSKLIAYKPYTLNEYKNIADSFKRINQGGLGANIGGEDWQKKYEKNQKIKDYNNEIMQKHKSLKFEYRNPTLEKEKEVKKKIDESVRAKAVDYCKKLPKNKGNTSNINESNNLETNNLSTQQMVNKDNFSFKQEFSLKEIMAANNHVNDINNLLSGNKVNIKNNNSSSHKHNLNKEPDISKDLNNLDLSNIFPAKDKEKEEDQVNYEMSNINPSPLNPTKKETNTTLNKWDLLDNNDEYQVDNELLELQKKRESLAEQILKIKESLA